MASLIFARHQNASKVFCVNDIYDQDYNINDDEHERRAAKEQNIPNLYMKSDDKFPTASRFKQLILNSKNKVRIQNLIENKLQAEVIYCTGVNCKNLTSGETMQEFTMNHSEADTMLLSIYHQLRVADYFGTVVIDTEDTDVYVQSAYVTKTFRLIVNQTEKIFCRLSSTGFKRSL